MKTKLLALMLLATGAVFAQLSIGVSIGAPPPMRIMRHQPRSPGSDYLWIGGYWYPNGNHYRWHDGYWTRPAYQGARWVEPRYDGRQYFAGYWDGSRGRFDHNHKWDRQRGRNRDFNRDQDRKDHDDRNRR